MLTLYIRILRTEICRLLSSTLGS